MRPLVFLSKIAGLLLLVFTATAFSFLKEDAVVSDDSGSGSRSHYSIEFRSADLYRNKVNTILKPYDHNNILPITLPLIADTGSWELADEINSNIWNAATSWIEGKILNADATNLKIFCHSDRYLSFVNTFTFEGNHYSYINDYITIDMQTGKRVMLNDLIDVNRDLVNHLRGKYIIYGTWWNYEDATDDWIMKAKESFQSQFKEIDSAELFERLKGCSLTNRQVSDTALYTITESNGSLIFRDSFYLKEGSLVLMLGTEIGKDIEVSVNDLTDFLKVEPW